ncbi:MAG TPA: hypothetical protein DDW71_00390 [Lactobacillus sp.]|nr:hypothetical protein [Lactobacillus sp.]
MELVHRYSRIYLAWKDHTSEFLSWDKIPHNGSWEFTSPFTSGVSPDMNELTLYNLTDEEFSQFLQGRSITITAGFYNSDLTEKNGGIITKGTIKSSTPMSLDTVDRSIQVNFNHFPDISSDTIKVKKVVKVRVKNTRKKAGGKSATDMIHAYDQKKTKELNTWLNNNPNASSHDRALKRKSIASEKKNYASRIRKSYTASAKSKKAKAKYAKQIKYANLSFKKGTKVSTAIKTIAKKAKVPLGAMKLTYDHKFADTYTVSGSPLNAIKKLADIANTDTYIDGAKLYVREITTGQKADLHLTPDTGLISHPTPSDDGTYNGHKYEAQSLMRHEIKVGALVYIDDSGVKNYGKCVVLSGQREYTTSSSTVTFQFVPHDDYKQAAADKLKKAKESAKKESDKAKLKAKNARAKDGKEKQTAKSKRNSRKTKK